MTELLNASGSRIETGVLLVQLDQARSGYPTALAKAAGYILENPELAIHQSVAELSSHAKVGQASVVRLCRELGFRGYTDFKLALSADLAKRQSQTVEAPVGIRTQLDETADTLCRSILDTTALLNRDMLEVSATRILEATRIDLFGLGVSGIVAELLGYRLLRVGLTANAMRDPALAQEVSGGLGPHAVVIAVSQSGTTTETVNFARSAAEKGSFVIAVTCHPKSPLARLSNAYLQMAKLDQPSYGGPITDVPRAVMVGEALSHAIEKAEAFKRSGNLE
ncbi:MurR/RpiR family transcriptional regulator [Pontivivens ytuae]|uniref:MurR/RpiR family transcriptional regulator n=1 Tax=Pontivivens ytuae TaxID=2789856 RepID=A0A7S9LU45_9RHOB|nr:MurR/RpiR family transcriptional regulator [Pontivivens ytuae]QPH54780.1 MurR/RpiR family transcriptional regulator [Pontivivens ytuae]